jgi:hypothetical protein
VTTANDCATEANIEDLQRRRRARLVTPPRRVADPASQPEKQQTSTLTTPEVSPAALTVVALLEALTLILLIRALWPSQ